LRYSSPGILGIGDTGQADIAGTGRRYQVKVPGHGVEMQGVQSASLCCALTVFYFKYRFIIAGKSG
jgi:hypothetical protein